MATKPTPGGSDGTYGTELNTFLDVSLAADGKVINEALQTASTAPTADAALANKKYVDDQCDAHIGTAGQFHAGTLVVNHSFSEVATTFETISLSGAGGPGANASMCYCQVKCTTFGSLGQIAFRHVGSTVAWANRQDVTNDNSGVALVDFATVSDVCYLILVTDSSGEVEAAATSNTNDIEISVIGYIV